jgi:dihydroorotate dehydrogenase electron transfer subunit
MKYIHDFKVIDNKRYNQNFSVLTLHLDINLPKILPGQFVEVKADNIQGVILRRPISIHDVDYKNNNIKLLIQNVGKGTEALCNLAIGTILNLIYPLGNGFPIPEKKMYALLVGGGCGVAPLLYLGRYLIDCEITTKFLIGARNSEFLLQIDELKKLGEAMITTENGSEGYKGNVLNHPVLNTKNPKFDIIYACGPEPMMKALSKYAEQHNITCYVSLENRMACGIGACLCCIVNTIEGNKCTCVEGPVFNSKYLQW